MKKDVMEILKADEKAKAMMKKFHETATEKGMTGKEYEEARKTMFMLIIATTPAAMNAMAEEIWEEANTQ